jgi:hypothetical protein
LSRWNAWIVRRMNSASYRGRTSCGRLLRSISAQSSSPTMSSLTASNRM